MEVTAPRWSLLSGQQSLGVHPLLGLDGQSDGVGRGADVLSPAINFNVATLPFHSALGSSPPNKGIFPGQGYPLLRPHLDGEDP